MARISWAGFETGTTQEFNGFCSNATPVKGMGRTGEWGCSILGSYFGIGNGRMHDIFPKNESEIYWRVAFRAPPDGMLGYSQILFGNENGAVVGPRFVWNIHVYLWQAWAPGQNFEDENAVPKASSPIALRADTWYILEGYLNATTGAYVFKINGVTAMAGTEAAFQSASGFRMWQIVGPYMMNGSSVYIDDLAVNNTEGPYENTYPGLGGIFYLKPNGDAGGTVVGGTNEWEPSEGTAHWALVDEAPRDTATWVQHLTPAAELYHLEDTPIYITQITVVQPVYQCAIIMSGSNQIRDLSSDGSAIYAGTVTNTIVTIAPSYVLYRGNLYHEQPNGTAGLFTREALDAFICGFEIPAGTA